MQPSFLYEGFNGKDGQDEAHPVESKGRMDGEGFLRNVLRNTGVWGENQLSLLLFRILIVRRGEPCKYSLWSDFVGDVGLIFSVELSLSSSSTYSKFKMNIITTPSSFFTGIMWVLHWKSEPARETERGGEQKNWEFSGFLPVSSS